MKRAEEFDLNEMRSSCSSMYICALWYIQNLTPAISSEIMDLMCNIAFVGAIDIKIED